MANDGFIMRQRYIYRTQSLTLPEIFWAHPKWKIQSTHSKNICPSKCEIIIGCIMIYSSSIGKKFITDKIIFFRISAIQNFTHLFFCRQYVPSTTVTQLTVETSLTTGQTHWIKWFQKFYIAALIHDVFDLKKSYILYILKQTTTCFTRSMENFDFIVDHWGSEKSYKRFIPRGKYSWKLHEWAYCWPKNNTKMFRLLYSSRFERSSIKLIPFCIQIKHGSISRPFFSCIPFFNVFRYEIHFKTFSHVPIVDIKALFKSYKYFSLIYVPSKLFTIKPKTISIWGYLCSPNDERSEWKVHPQH